MPGFLVVVGGAQLCAAMSIDFFIRVRMQRVGRKNIFLLGGLFNYGEYTSLCAKSGWSVWPMYLMWFLLIGGLICVTA
jgi:hypothetical protein